MNYAILFLVGIFYGNLLAAQCTITLNPGDDIAEAISSATEGTVICLNDGTYSGISLSNIDKGSMVTVRSVNGAANVNVGFLNLNNVSYVHFDNVTFTGGQLTGHHLHITNSIGTAYILNGVSQILRIVGTIANADILIDHINYSDIPNPCLTNDCVEGRISILGGPNPSGITISNSYFSGGNSDGIQVGGNAGQVQIIGNEFVGIQAANGTHTDPIQLYGQGPGTVIKNNYFHDCATGIMAGDGGSGEQIIGNVFDLTGYPYGIVMGNWVNSTIQHNTFKFGTSCSWNSCGTLWVKSSTDLILKDNIIGELKVESGTLTEDYNLINVGGSVHGNTIMGLPTFIGGANPTTYAGFQLAAGSLGKNDASDGLDRGVVYSGTPQADSIAPSLPTNLKGSSNTSYQINLTWTASTDDMGVSGYKVERCDGEGCDTFTEIATAYANSFTNIGLAANTFYTYRVRATDAAGNLSAYSNTVSVTTQEAPACITSSASWQAQAFENQSATFEVTYDGTPLTDHAGVLLGLSDSPVSQYSDLAVIVRFNDTGVIDARNGDDYSAASSIPYIANTAYHFRLVVNIATHTYNAYVTPDGGSEIAIGINYAFRSDQSAVSELGYWNLDPVMDALQVCNFAVSLQSDVTPPSAPSGLSSRFLTYSSFVLRWAASTDDVAVIGYEVFKNGESIGITETTSMAVMFLDANTSYSMTVRAFDGALNFSGQGETFEVTTEKAPHFDFYTIFTAQVPGGGDADGPYELGTKFQTSEPGAITKLRFYKAVGETGLHTGRLWSSDGNILASANYGNETASGWQEITLETPYNLSINTTYVVSVNINHNYVATSKGLQSKVSNGPLSTVVGDNGVFAQPAGDFPNNAWEDSNYFIDVVFVPTSTGLWDISSKSDKSLLIYPNPVKSSLKIRTNFEVGKRSELRIYNALGDEVFSKKINSTEETIDTSNLPNGVYLLRLALSNVERLQTNKTISSQKFIVQH